MNNQKRYYLDNAATTPVAPAVRAAMLPFFDEYFGNPSALYSYAKESGQAVSRAREQVAALIGSNESEIVFTSGATESNNWALWGSIVAGKRKHIITSAVEHHAVLEAARGLVDLLPGVTLTVLPVDAHGRVAPSLLREALRDDTAIVSIMHANNEIGTLQPIRELAAIAHEYGALFHTDAVQSVGKIPVAVKELGVDLLSLSAHKFHGPKGIGALYLRKGTRLPPLLRGGGQEFGLRPGTSNVPGIAGLGKAAELALTHVQSDKPHHLRTLTEALWADLAAIIPDLRRNSPADASLPGLLNFCVAGAEGEALLMYLDMAGICVASGSACSTRNLHASHVLTAIGICDELAHGALRLSLSRYSTDEDTRAVKEHLPGVIDRVRQMSATYNRILSKPWQPS